MEIKKEIIINESVEKVWDLLGNQYADAYKWARGLNYSNGYGEPQFNGASCNNRTCEVSGFGTIEEEIRMFDPKDHILTYEVKKGLPGFINTAVNTWSLTKVGTNTRVNMHMKMATQGFKGMIMGPLMKMQLNKLVAGAMEDLKIYLETGKPSIQKQKEIRKYQKNAA